MTRQYNFCAGPAALPEEVLEQARDEMLDWHGAGLSVMEMSHRSPEIVGIYEDAEHDLRELLAVPADYRILFVQGGASTQFAAVPLNLAGAGSRADYVNTGQWSKKAIAEAGRYLDVNVSASSEDTNFSTIPPTCITPPTRRLVGSNSSGLRTLTYRWRWICHRLSSVDPSTCRNLASSTRVPRKTSAPRA